MSKFRYFVCKDCGVVEGRINPVKLGRLKERHKDCEETSQLYIGKEKTYRDASDVTEFLEWMLGEDGENQ